MVWRCIEQVYVLVWCCGRFSISVCVCAEGMCIFSGCIASRAVGMGVGLDTCVRSGWQLGFVPERVCVAAKECLAISCRASGYIEYGCYIAMDVTVV